MELDCCHDWKGVAVIGALSDKKLLHLYVQFLRQIIRLDVCQKELRGGKVIERNFQMIFGSTTDSLPSLNGQILRLPGLVRPKGTL